MKLLRSLYSDISYSIKSNGEYSVSFSSKCGVKQGCNLSPLLFNLFVNDLHDNFDASCSPVSLGAKHISSLSFADDLVLLSETTVGLQNSLEILQNYCHEWGLDINIDKTKVVVFNRAFRKTHKFSFFVNNSPIEVAKSYRYLGVTITSTGSFHLNMQEVRNKALRALYSLYSSISLYSGEGTISLFLKLFKILIKPILLYAWEIWGFTTFTTCTIISKFVGKFYKNLLGVPNSTSNVAVHLELGCLPVEIDIKESILKYWLRLVQLPSNRLVHHAYQFLLQNNISDSWMSAVRNIFNHTGYSFIWDEQNDLSFHDKMFSKSLSNQISESMMNQFIQTSDRCMFTERKLNYFFMFKEAFELSNTLSAFLNDLNIRSWQNVD